MAILILTAMEWLGSACVAVNRVQVMGSSLLRPKQLGEKHKPIFKINTVDSLHYHEYVVDILRSGRETEQNEKH